jgi:hypothetical protein
MKKACLIIGILIGGSRIFAQEPMSYYELLAATREISVEDSVRFDTMLEDQIVIDSLTVKKWFPQILSVTANNKFKHKKYSLGGKITTNEQFDLLILLEEKNRPDSSGIQVTYLVSTKKSGDYIASLKAAVTGTKKKSGYNISSRMSRDFKIIQDSHIITNNQSYDEMAFYRISRFGRFILSSGE